MSKDHRVLARHLFSEICATLEIAHAFATEGQRPDLTAPRERAITKTFSMRLVVLRPLQRPLQH